VAKKNYLLGCAECMVISVQLPQKYVVFLEKKEISMGSVGPRRHCEEMTL